MACRVTSITETSDNLCRSNVYLQHTRALEERLRTTRNQTLRRAEIALNEQFGTTSVAAVEVHMDANAAANEINELAQAIYMHGQDCYPPRVLLDGWELSARRCERAYGWADRLGVLSDENRIEFARYLQPILKMLQTLRTATEEFAVSWKSVASPVTTGWQMVWEDEAEEQWRQKQDRSELEDAEEYCSR